MSNIGYDNWDDSGEDMDYSMSSTSDKGKSPLGKAAVGGSSGQDNLDISGDDDIDLGGYDPTIRNSTKNSSAALSSRALYHELGPTSSLGKKPAPTRRMSTDDRMKEILARQQLATDTALGADDPAQYTSDPSTVDPAWEQMRASILEGVEVTKKSASTAAKSPGGGNSMNSSVVDTSDSFELDDTDLQVGAYAARRSVEKTSERRRRSLNVEDISKKGSPSRDSVSMRGDSGKDFKSNLDQIEEMEDDTPARKKVDESPNVRRTARRQSYDLENTGKSAKEIPGFQMSQALSSIEYGGRMSVKNFGSVESDEMLRYGSVEKSDGELYDILNRQSSSEQSQSQSYQSEGSQAKRRARTTASIYSEDDDYSDSNFDEPMDSVDRSEHKGKEKQAEKNPTMTTVEEIQARWSNPESVLGKVLSSASADPTPSKSTPPPETIVKQSESKISAGPVSPSDSSAAAEMSTGGQSTTPVTLDTKAMYVDAVTSRYGLDNTADSSVLRGSKSEDTAASSSMVSASEASSEHIPAPKYEEVDQQKETDTPEVTNNSNIDVNADTITPVPSSTVEREAQLAATVKVTKDANEAVVTTIVTPATAITSTQETHERIQESSEASNLEGKDDVYAFPTYNSSENLMENAQMPSTLDLPVWDADQLEHSVNEENENEKVMEEEATIYYTANDSRSNGNKKNDSSITSQYRMNKSKASPARSSKTSQGQSVAKISAVEVNPAFFGYKAEEDKQEVSTKSSFQGKRMEGPVPVLPPNLSELRAQLKVLHSNKKRKVSPIKRSAPLRGTPQSGIPIRSVGPAPVRPQTSRVSTSNSVTTQDNRRGSQYSRLNEPRANDRNSHYASTRIMRGGKTTRSQSPRPKPLSIEDEVNSGMSSVYSSARRSQSSAAAMRSHDASSNYSNDVRTDNDGDSRKLAPMGSSSSRLAQQFSDLEAQVASVQRMQKEMQASVRANNQAIAANNHAIDAVASRDPLPTPAKFMSASQPSFEPSNSRASNLRRSGTVPPTASSSFDATAAAAAASVRASSERRNGPVDSNEVLQSMIETLRESSHLSLREVAVREREKSLSAMESHLLSRDVRKSHSEKFNVKEVEQQAEEYRDKEKEYMTREARLRQELETMKASMFKLQQEKDAALSRLPKFSAPQDQEWLTDDGQEAKPFDAESIKNETVTIPRAEYEKITKELQFQESLLSGFQKENDKLAAQLKERETEEAYRTSKYFDERETLNKELNRLRNIIGVSAGIDDEETVSATHTHPYIQKADDGLKTFVGVQRSSELLRADLEKDAMIQGLQDRLLEDKAEASLRVKELQEVIDKLRVENKRLEQTSHKAAMSNLEHMDLKASYLALQKEKRQTLEELEKLKEKLRWYGENQELLEHADSDKLEMRNTIMNLKKELSSYKSGSGKSGHDISDTSMMSTGFGGSSSRKGRDPADVKKIEDLKKALSDLQEGMNKRYPDSVSSLIQASKLSDSVQKEQEEKEKKLTKTTEELKKVKDDYDRRLRSLRQEHEKVKMGYEERIKNLQNNQTLPSSSSTNSTAPVKNLPAANAKIKELEKEVERIRSFYTKKLDEVTRKFETQIRALKRGDENNMPHAHSKEDSESQIGTQGTQEVKDIVTNVDKDGNTTVPVGTIKQYQLQVEMLEKELMSTAEDLGKQKAMAEQAIIAANEAKAELAKKISPDSSTNDSFRASNDTYDREVQPESALSPPKPTPPTPPPVQVLLSSDGDKDRVNGLNDKILALSTELVASRNEAIRAVKQMDTAQIEITSLRGKLEETKDELQQTRIELISLQAKEAQSSPKKAIALLETQVNRLEENIMRREKELQGMLDETKAAAKLELSRLKSIHSQEIVEKDQQLAGFQRELEELVGALRRYSLRSLQDSAMKINDVPTVVTVSTPVESN